MPIPSVEITKSDGNTGVVRPSATGILAIIAPSASGTKNQAASFARADLILTEFGHGPLAEYAAYVMNVAKKPVVVVRPDTSTAGSYSSLTVSSGGTAAPTAGATEPLDDFDVVIEIVSATTLGTSGTYRYSLDGGETYSKVLALGTALNVVIPNTGITVVLGASTETLSAGRTIAFTTKAPEATTADLVDAFEALRVSALPWEAVLIHGTADDDHVSSADQWLEGLEASGRHRVAFINSKFKGSDTEADFNDDLAVIAGAAASTRVVFGADGGRITSPIRGIKMVRPTSLAAAARAMAVDISVEPAYVADGSLSGVEILDDRGNPLFHNEALYPGPDDNRFTTLRTFERRPGAYVCNTNLFSEPGSDYVYLPHARVMNRACEIVFDLLTQQLSAGVLKDGIHIHEDSAGAIEGLVQAALESALQGRVSAVAFTLSRTDDISANGGATLSGTLEIQSLALVKKFEVVSRFVRTITAQAA